MTGFTYTGPSVGATMVVGVFNEQLAVAQNRLEEADKYMAQALGVITQPTAISAVNISADLDIPKAPALDGFTPAEMNGLYQSTADEIKDLLGEGLTTFFSTYFPLGTELAAAQAWVNKALTTGGTGLNASVENQIWERDRARVLKDAERARNEAMSVWAARGYPLPPGALVGQVSRIDHDTRDKIAQASRDVAIKQAEMEVGNVRFAVDKAITMRTTAIQAAGDYIRTLALGPQLGVQLAASMMDAKTKMAQALTSFYQAEVSALELPARVAIAEANANVEVQKSNQGAAMAVIDARVRVVEAAAQSAGTQAAAALNALHGSAGFSTSEQA